MTPERHKLSEAVVCFLYKPHSDASYMDHGQTLYGVVHPSGYLLDVGDDKALAEQISREINAGRRALNGERG